MVTLTPSGRVCAQAIPLFGGMLEMFLFFIEQLLPSVDACGAVINMIHKLLTDCMRSSLISSGDTASEVSSGNIFQTSHADTVLHPVTAWNMHRQQ